MSNKGLLHVDLFRQAILVPSSLIVLLTSGCISSSGSPSQVQEMVDARVLGSETNSPAPAHIRTTVQPPKAAILQAVLASDRYQSAVNYEVATINDIDTARSVLQPQISLVSRVGQIKKIGGVDAGKNESGAAAGLTATQLLYDGGVSKAASERAVAASIEARARKMALANQIAYDALSAWIAHWQTNQRLALANEQSNELGSILAQIERMYSNGMIDRGTIEVAKRKISQADLRLIELRAGSAVATLDLRRYFSSELPANILPTDFLNSGVVLKSIEEQSSSPTIQEAAARLVASELSVTSAQAAMSPTVSLEGGLNSPTTANGSGDASIGIVLEYRFGSGGKLEAELKSAQAQQSAVESDLASKKEELKFQLNADLSRFAAIEQTLEVQKSQVVLLERELETLTSQLATGQSSLSQVMESKLALFQTKDMIIITRAEKMGILASIAAKTGYLATVIGIE